MSKAAYELKAVPDLAEDPGDPALTGMESVEGREIAEPTPMSRVLEEFRALLAELGIPRRERFGVRAVDGKTRIVRLNSDGEVVGVMPPHLSDEQRSGRGDHLRIVEEN